jgi:hypothetical protein
MIAPHAPADGCSQLRGDATAALRTQRLLGVAILLGSFLTVVIEKTYL